MYFYEVLVSSQRYHGSEPLTYSSNDELSAGSVVVVPMGQQQCPGVVLLRTERPTFEAKPIARALETKLLPAALLDLYNWLYSYYPGPAGLLTQLFLPAPLTTTGRKAKPKKQQMTTSTGLPSLTKEQLLAVNTIQAKEGSFLLHGETGSGKTRVYLELTKKALAENQSALILTPEIGLTPQLAQTFEDAFPGSVVVTHSTQTAAQRRDSWLRINDSEQPIVVIGPRSALFAPIANLGLVIVDEAHDTAYKQEQMPYYQTTRVAAKLANIHGARLVLGSATPSVQDYYAFKAKELPILRMESSAKETKAASIQVVDLKQRSDFSRSAWLSDPLIKLIERALNDGMQSLVFLNRRGTARLVLCQNCGWQATCPRCDLPLTYHGDTHNLRCHTCGYTTTAPSVCPECGSADIQFKSIGTKTLADEVQRLFPKARIGRFDSDNKKAESLTEQYQVVRDGKLDILVGTQLLSKGLDLPKLSVVGVIAADTSLYFPDYTADERTFQMLKQVIGRVGRGHQDSHVIIQTYHPDNPAIQAVVKRDYAGFYESQLRERELYHFPPFYFVLKVAVERAVQSAARKTSQDLAQQILGSGLAIELSGPAPAFVERTHGKFRWQLTIKAKDRGQLLEVIKLLPKNCSYDIDPSNLL